ncbi:MAG TPA: hypothetical protein VGB15_21880 [Longimicrobium sp.]
MIEQTQFAWTPTVNKLNENVKRHAAPGLRHSLLTLESAFRADVVAERFGHLIDVSAEPLLALSLYDFTATRPLKYLDVAVLERFLSFCENAPEKTLAAMEKHSDALTHAIISLVRTGTSWDLEHAIAVRSPADFQAFDQIWHPEYQRYVEHIYHHLIKVPLEVIGGNAKDLVGQALAKQVQTLTKHGLVQLVAGFNSTVRNAISHGNITYADIEIRYADKKDVVELTGREFANLFDTLVNTCHAMAAALLLFICRNSATVHSRGLASVPAGLRYLLLKGMCSHSGFTVDGMWESHGPMATKQLVIYCRSTTRARLAHVLDSLSVATHAYQHGGEVYSGFVVQVDCGPKIPATAVYPADQVKRLLEHGWGAVTRELFEVSLLWYDASRFRLQLWTLTNILRTNWKRSGRNLVKAWRSDRVDVWRTKYDVRTVQNRSASGVRRLHAEIVLRPSEEVTKRVVRGVLRHASKRLSRLLLVNKRFGQQGRLGRTPTYVWLRLHRYDARVRELEQRGSEDPGFLAGSEWIAQRKDQPIVEKQPDEMYGGIRITFNRAIEFPD